MKGNHDKRNKTKNDNQKLLGYLAYAINRTVTCLTVELKIKSTKELLILGVLMKISGQLGMSIFPEGDWRKKEQLDGTFDII